MPQDGTLHEIVGGKDDCSQDNAHALFQHNNSPIINNLFANLEIEPSECQTRRRDGVIRDQKRPQVAVGVRPVRTPPTELWSSSQSNKNQPISEEQRNATKTWTQHPSSTNDHESPSIPSSSPIRMVSPPSSPLGSNALGPDKTKSGKPNTPLSPRTG